MRAVAGSGNGVDVIEALAGTGKTYTAGVLRELYEDAGYTVVGVAPTARAARELAEQAGISSRTLDSRVLAINAGRDLPPRSVVVFDEAGMASTRLSEQLLAHAATVGAKVIAIGDPGQLASVQAGGWLRTIGERLGAVRLTEVMRQRDPAERLALAALHDGAPARWIEWATHAGRVEVVPDGRGVLEQAVGEWAAGAARHGVEQSVLICRDNETRRALNTLAREHRRDAGELGEEISYGPVTVAVGDRVICRNNERDLDIDNGTRGTVRHVHDAGDRDRDRRAPDTRAAGGVRRRTRRARLRADRPRHAGRHRRTRDRRREPSRPLARLVLHRALTRPRRHPAPRARQRSRRGRARGIRPGNAPADVAAPRGAGARRAAHARP